MSLCITSFHVPRHIALAVHGSPPSNTGVFIETTTTMDVVGLALRPVAGGYRCSTLHRLTNARPLASWLGAIAHGGHPGPRVLTCALEPKRDPITLFDNDNGWVGLLDQSGLVPQLLDRDRVEAWWMWLTRWIETADPRHKAARTATFRSIEQEQAWNRSMRECAIGNAPDDE